MTRKDYEKIAEVLRETYGESPVDDLYMAGWNSGLKHAVRDITCRMAAMLEQDNPRFDADKFLKACGF